MRCSMLYVFSSNVLRAFHCWGISAYLLIEKWDPMLYIILNYLAALLHFQAETCKPR